MKKLKLPPIKNNIRLKLPKTRRGIVILVGAFLVIAAIVAALLLAKGNVLDNKSADAKLSDVLNSQDCDKGLESLKKISVDGESRDTRIKFLQYKMQCESSLENLDAAIATGGKLMDLYLKEGSIQPFDVTRLENTIQSLKQEKIDADREAQFEKESRNVKEVEHNGPIL